MSRSMEHRHPPPTQPGVFGVEPGNPLGFLSAAGVRWHRLQISVNVSRRDTPPLCVPTNCDCPPFTNIIPCTVLSLKEPPLCTSGRETSVCDGATSAPLQTTSPVAYRLIAIPDQTGVQEVCVQTATRMRKYPATSRWAFNLQCFVRGFQTCDQVICNAPPTVFSVCVIRNAPTVCCVCEPQRPDCLCVFVCV